MSSPLLDYRNHRMAAYWRACSVIRPAGVGRMQPVVPEDLGYYRPRCARWRTSASVSGKTNYRPQRFSHLVGKSSRYAPVLRCQLAIRTSTWSQRIDWHLRNQELGAIHASIHKAPCNRTSIPCGSSRTARCGPSYQRRVKYPVMKS